MKLTLLEVVQTVLSDMDSDEVNSISDTVESLQVASIAEQTYYYMVEENEWYFSKKLRELESVSDVNRPNYLRLPDEVSEVYWIKYDATEASDTKTEYRTLTYKNPEDFLIMVQSRDDSQSDIDTVVDFNSVPMFIYNERPPTYWTTFDDEYVVTDAYDSDVESTHQASKSVAYVAEEPSFSQDDSFVPDLPAKMFPLYLNEVKSAAMFYLKQQEDAIGIRRMRRQKALQNHKEYRLNARKRVDFGRK